MTIVPFTGSGKDKKITFQGFKALLPRDVWLHILEYLNMYEAIGLGTVSKELKSLSDEFMGRHHYEPWAVDAWSSLGMVEGSDIEGDRRKKLEILAAEAFRYIAQSLGKTLNMDPNPGVSCELIAEIARDTPTLDGTSTVYGRNCLAVLRMNGKKIWAVNFKTNIPIEVLQQKLIGYSGNEINYDLVKMRHSEIRLIIKVAHGHGPFQLDIDKVCCIFCAAQLVSLGHNEVVTGWNKGALSWYTFAPLVMYFKDKRERIWGSTTEVLFQSMTRDERLLFLKLLVSQTKPSTPTKHIEISTSTEIVQPLKKQKVTRECPNCGETQYLKQSQSGSGTYWACWNYKNHKK